MPQPLRVSKRNARFQEWSALLTNRSKRTRSGLVVVQGVRPITLAVEAGVEVVELLVDGSRRRSAWAKSILARSGGRPVEVAPDLLAELGGKDDAVPELVLVARTPGGSLDLLSRARRDLHVVFDRPSSPGNIGTLARSLDALGGGSLIVCGHAADPWDPQSVRSSTGSIFSLPVVRAESADVVLGWVERRRRDGEALRVLGTDEDGTVDLVTAALDGPLVIVIGNETSGMSRAWREACDDVVRIPLDGSASSLNAATAASIVLYEVLRRGLTTG